MYPKTTIPMCLVLLPTVMAPLGCLRSQESSQTTRPHQTPDVLTRRTLEALIRRSDLARSALTEHEFYWEKGLESSMAPLVDWSLRLRDAECAVARMKEEKSPLIQSLTAHSQRIQRWLGTAQARASLGLGIEDVIELDYHSSMAEAALALEEDHVPAVRLLSQCEQNTKRALEFFEAAARKEDVTFFRRAFVAQSRLLDSRVSLAGVNGDKPAERAAVQEYASAVESLYRRAQPAIDAGRLFPAAVGCLYTRARGTIAMFQEDKNAEMNALGQYVVAAERIINTYPWGWEFDGAGQKERLCSYFEGWTAASVRLATLRGDKEEKRRVLERAMGKAREILRQMTMRGRDYRRSSDAKWLGETVAEYLVVGVEVELLRNGFSVPNGASDSRPASPVTKPQSDK